MTSGDLFYRRNTTYRFYLWTLEFTLCTVNFVLFFVKKKNYKSDFKWKRMHFCCCCCYFYCCGSGICLDLGFTGALFVVCVSVVMYHKDIWRGLRWEVSRMFRRALFCLLRFIVTGVSCLFFLIRKALHTVMFINSQSLAYRKTRLSPLLSVSSSSERRRSVSVLLIQHLWGGWIICIIP